MVIREYALFYKVLKKQIITSLQHETSKNMKGNAWDLLSIQSDRVQHQLLQTSEDIIICKFKTKSQKDSP
jgi:hypothetical protein